MQLEHTRYAYTCMVDYFTNCHSEHRQNVTFTQGMYSVREDEEILTVSVEKFGDKDFNAVVLIATHPSEGTATGEL